MAEITTKDITTGSISGTGVFDELMASAQTRLDSQYKQNRIKGADYSKVYLGGMEAILMNSIQFVLGRQEASAKADLILEQTLTEKKQRRLVTAQISKMGKEEDLIDQQILKMIQEVLVMKAEVGMIPDKVALLKAQVRKMEKEGDLIDGQIQKMIQEIEFMRQQALKMTQEVEVMKKEVVKMDGEIRLINAQADKTVEEVKLINHQIDKMIQEVLVMEQQVKESIQKVETMRASVWAERAKTNSKPTIFNETYDPWNLTPPLTEVSGLVGNQIKKTDAEVDLLKQKGYTEEAQTKDIVGNPGYTVVGVLGKQKGLYQKQTEGFDRDAEQKLSKIMVDSWNTRRISNDEENPLGTGLENPDICSVLAVAKAGIKANSEGCVGDNNGDNVDDIVGVDMDILARTNVLEDCEAMFESHITLDSLPTVHIHEWCWDVGLQGREASSQCKLEGETAPVGYFFFTKFFEPGPNTITLTITLWDTDTESEYHNRKVTFKKTFEAIATDTPHDGPTDCSGLLSLTSLAEKAVRDAHPDDYAMTANPKTDPMTWGDIRPVTAQHGTGDTAKHGEKYTYENYPALKPKVTP